MRYVTRGKLVKILKFEIFSSDDSSAQLVFQWFESRAKIAAQVWDDHGLLSYNYHY